MLGIILEITTTPATKPAAIDFTWLFVKMLIALAVVCILAVIILKYAVPRMGLFKKFSSGKFVEIMGRQSLDQKKHLYIIKVGSRYALIGSSEQSVNLIMELKREDVEYQGG